MKKLSILLLVAGLACSKHHDPGFTSAAGNWTYTSPDSKVTVTLVLAGSAGGGLVIQSQGIKINGVEYIAAAQLTGVALPAIQKIQVNANDPLATYAYNVEFDNCTVSTDFKTINVASGFYTYPNGTTHVITAAKFTRM